MLLILRGMAAFKREGTLKDSATFGCMKVPSCETCTIIFESEREGENVRKGARKTEIIH